MSEMITGFTVIPKTSHEILVHTQRSQSIPKDTHLYECKSRSSDVTYL